MSDQVKGCDTNSADQDTPKSNTVDNSKVDTSTEETQVGLLDQPLVLEGKRKRKSVQSFQSPSETPSKKKVLLEEGKGFKLGDIASVEAALGKKQTDELRFLYKLLFDQPGNKQDMRKHIRSFSGFSFSESSSEHKRKLASLEKQQKQALETFYCQPLGLSVSGNKKELAARIADFLLCPQEGSSKATPKRAPSTKTTAKRKRPSKANEQAENSMEEQSKSNVEDDMEDVSSCKVDGQDEQKAEAQADEEGKVKDMETSSGQSKDKEESSCEEVQEPAVEPHNTNSAAEECSKPKEEAKPEKEGAKECVSPAPEQQQEDETVSNSNNCVHSSSSNPVKATPEPAQAEPTKKMSQVDDKQLNSGQGAPAVEQ